MAIKLRKKQKNKVAVVKKIVAQPAQASAVQSPSVVTTTFNLPKTKFVEAVGRRKVATARVRLYPGKGDFVVNNMLVTEYFRGIRNAESVYNKPFALTGSQDSFAVSALVKGSGARAQLEAIVHGLAQALVQHKPEFKIFLKAGNLLTRDDRMKETRKIGTGGKARRKRQSPKR